MVNTYISSPQDATAKAGRLPMIAPRRARARATPGANPKEREGLQ
eukprot:COSAG06_NODE_72_length_25897_cov_9.227382_4_plen_45_part_00